MKKILGITLAFVGFASFEVRAGLPPLELVDSPTPEVTNHYGVNMAFRFYSQGGLLTKTSFGVFPRLNVGFGLDAEKFVGGESVDINRPTLNMKYRFFDGQRHLPALAAGYDGQGFFFDKGKDKYLQREKGLYLTGTGEVLVPHLDFTGGVNIYDFREDRVFVFTGLHYLYHDVLSLVAEVDNLRLGRDARLSGGVRYHTTPHFSIELMARDLGAPGRNSERVVRLSHNTSF
jgi:hypothetical protein